jgi:hypothetical protein
MLCFIRSNSRGTPHCHLCINNNRLCECCALTSISHNALRTFSSKLGSTKLATSLGIVDNVSFRSMVIGMLSRRLDMEDLPKESELDRGGGEDDLVGTGVSAGEVADS